MKLSWKREILAIAVLVAVAIVSIHYYPILPDRMPSHFNIQGKVDGWTGKNTFFLMWWAYFIVPYLLITFLPFFDPLKRKIEPRFKVLLLLRDILLIFFAVLFLLSLSAGLGGKSFVNWFNVAVGIFLIMVGNYMPKFPQNWFVGIKTPWTISSEVVWKKTHILGGWLFAATGLVWIVFAAFGFGVAVPSLMVMFSTAVTVIYSFIAYKKIEHVNVAKT